MSTSDKSNADEEEMREQLFSVYTPPASPNCSRSMSQTSNTSTNSTASVWDGCNSQQDWVALHLR